MLCDTPEICKCFNALSSFGPNLCFMIGFICRLFDARNDSWSTQTKQMYVFATMEAEGDGRSPVKLA